MKNNLLYILLLIVIAFSACKKDGLAKYDIEKSFADPSVSLDDLKKQITSGVDGFQMLIEPSTGKYYAGYISFDGNSTAKFLLDNSTVNATTLAETKYSLITRQTNPTLSLGTTTSSFAVLARNLGGIDSTYTYKSSNGDTLRFTGNVLGSKLILVKTSKANATEYLGGKMSDAITSINNFSSFKLYFKRLTVGSKTYDLILNPKYKFVTISYLDGTTFKRYISYYGYSNNGIIFKSVFSDGTNTIGGISNISVDVASNSATAKIGAGIVAITNAATPLAYDLTAVTKFYANGNTLVPATGVNLSWLSYTGFTVNGVKDYFGVTTIPNFNYNSFTPRYSTYDRLGFIVNGAIAAYGPAITTSIKTNGTISFTYLGTFGNPAAAYTAVVNNTRIQLCDAQGYYVIQTGTSQFDFVNVKDGTAWISWE